MDRNYLRVRLTNVRSRDSDTIEAEVWDYPEQTYQFVWDKKTHRFHEKETGAAIISSDEIFYLELLFNDEPGRDPTFAFMA